MYAVDDRVYVCLSGNCTFISFRLHLKFLFMKLVIDDDWDDD